MKMQLLIINKYAFIKGYVFLSILLSIVGCKTPSDNSSPYDGYTVSRVWMYEDNILDIQANSDLSESIIIKLVDAKKVAGPIKGVGIYVELTNHVDTIKILSYGGAKYFHFNDGYYETNSNLLPDSIWTSYHQLRNK
jgi:hypothetical protein